MKIVPIMYCIKHLYAVIILLKNGSVVKIGYLFNIFYEIIYTIFR